jgi:hypothetical protein
MNRPVSKDSIGTGPPYASNEPVGYPAGLGMWRRWLNKYVLPQLIASQWKLLYS